MPLDSLLKKRTGKKKDRKIVNKLQTNVKIYIQFKPAIMTNLWTLPTKNKLIHPKWWTGNALTL